MPVAGRKPTPDGKPKQNRNPVMEWTEVEDVPFDGPWPDLPSSYSEATGIYGPDDVTIAWLPFAKRWWNTVKRMPHAALWTETDWLFAISTVPVVQRAMAGTPASAMTELRNREKLIGTTLDSRRDLRIKYVPKKEDAPALAVVTAMDGIRDL